jgi:hypothetical protein
MTTPIKITPENAGSIPFPCWLWNVFHNEWQMHHWQVELTKQWYTHYSTSPTKPEGAPDSLYMPTAERNTFTLTAQPPAGVREAIESALCDTTDAGLWPDEHLSKAVYAILTALTPFLRGETPQNASIASPIASPDIAGGPGNCKKCGKITPNVALHEHLCKSAVSPQAERLAGQLAIDFHADFNAGVTELSELKDYLLPVIADLCARVDSLKESNRVLQSFQDELLVKLGEADQQLATAERNLADLNQSIGDLAHPNSPLLLAEIAELKRELAEAHRHIEGANMASSVLSEELQTERATVARLREALEQLSISYSELCKRTGEIPLKSLENARDLFTAGTKGKGL